MKFALALVATVAARHHHHHRQELVSEEAELNAMSDSALVSTLEATLHSALAAEARDALTCTTKPRLKDLVSIYCQDRCHQEHPESFYR